MGCVRSKNKTQTVQSTTLLRSARKYDSIDVQMIQNVHLIWLDANIDENRAVHQKTVTHFRHPINNMDKFIDSEECLQFLGNAVPEKICTMISGSFGQQMAPRVCNLLQVDSIFICYEKKKYHKESSKDWSKIKSRGLGVSVPALRSEGTGTHLQFHICKFSSPLV